MKNKKKCSLISVEELGRTWPDKHYLFVIKVITTIPLPLSPIRETEQQKTKKIGSIFNRPGVAGAALHTASSLNH